MHEAYEALTKNPANFVALTPLSFLQRTADVYPDRDAVVYGERKYTWQKTRERCGSFASALIAHGINVGDTISVLAFNTPELFEAHFAVPRPSHGRLHSRSR